MPTTKHWTSKDLATLPSPEGTRYEIIAGELFVSTQPHWHHQYTCGRLFRALLTSEVPVWVRRALPVGVPR